MSTEGNTPESAAAREAILRRGGKLLEITPTGPRTVQRVALGGFMAPDGTFHPTHAAVTALRLAAPGTK